MGMDKIYRIKGIKICHIKNIMDDLTTLLEEILLCDPQEKRQKEEISETELYQKYKATYSAAFADLGQHALFLWGTLYALYLYKDSYMTIFTVPLLVFMLNRTFIVFHDCQHGSYTPSPIVNYLISHITGTFVLTSPNWIIDHHTHHLTNGNVENEYHYKYNELIDYTKREYLSFTEFEKVCFYVFYNRYTYFSIFPATYFYIVQRFIYITKKIKYGKKIKKHSKNNKKNHSKTNKKTF
jgi:fatty acid desaturase